MAEEAVQDVAECDQRDRIADEDLGADCPVEEGHVAGMPRPAIDAGAHERMLGCLVVHDQVREVGSSCDHGQRAKVLRRDGYDET